MDLAENTAICRESAKGRLDRSNARSQMMKIIGELSVDASGLKFVDSMVKLAGFVEKNEMDRGGRNEIGERKGGDEVLR
jgi:hypothetical protein